MAKYLNTQHIIFLKNENNKNKVFSFFSTYQGFFARQQEFTINMRFFFSLNTKPLTNSQLSYSITFITKNLYFFLRLYFLFLNSKKKKELVFLRADKKKIIEDAKVHSFTVMFIYLATMEKKKMYLHCWWITWYSPLSNSCFSWSNNSWDGYRSNLPHNDYLTRKQIDLD